MPKVRIYFSFPYDFFTLKNVLLESATTGNFDKIAVKDQLRFFVFVGKIQLKSAVKGILKCRILKWCTFIYRTSSIDRNTSSFHCC